MFRYRKVLGSILAIILAISCVCCGKSNNATSEIEENSDQIVIGFSQPVQNQIIIR